MSRSQPHSSAQRSRAYRKRMRAAGYRAAEVWRLDTTDAVVRARVESQLRKLANAADDPDWTVEPEFADWR